MFVRALKYTDRGRGRAFRRVLVLVLACGLIWSGGLVWADNAVAVILDFGSDTYVSLELLDTYAGNDGPPDHSLHQTGQVPDSRATRQMVIHGNGGADDNREGAFLFRPPFGLTVAARVTAAVTTFHERRTVAAVYGFWAFEGHGGRRSGGCCFCDRFTY